MRRLLVSTENFISNLTALILHRAGQLWKAVVLMLDAPPHTAEQEESFVEAKTSLSNMLDNTYKFSDVLFKSVSWLGALVVVNLLRDTTGYGVFWMIEAIAYVSLCCFVISRLTFPVIYLLRYFPVGSSSSRAFCGAVVISVFIAGMSLLTWTVVPITLKKIEYSQRCHRQTDNSTPHIAGCGEKIKHSRIVIR